MVMITSNQNISYELVKDYRDGFNNENFKEKCTDYFDDFDYIFGDYAYDKLRLKGFYESNNKNSKPINDIKFMDKYIKEYCAFDCRYFLLKKVRKSQ